MTPDTFQAVITQIVPILTTLGIGVKYLMERGKVRVRTVTRVSRSDGSAEYRDRVLRLAEERIRELEAALADCQKGGQP